jgi:hypothetical protein
VRKYHRAFAKPRDGVTKEGTMIYFARKHDCDACALKSKCCPNVPVRKIARSIHEAARDKARTIAKTEAYAGSCRERKKVEMLFAHLMRILRLGRLRLRGPKGAKDEFLLAATAQNLRKLAKLIPLRANLRHIRRRARIPPADCRRNRYPLSSAEGVLQHNPSTAVISDGGISRPERRRGSSWRVSPLRGRRRGPRS